ncbi:MAG: hypothetical protein NT028_11245 [candidate division Zixibacteria bacterium]|nr:hypothetical protein [candidate division Zixibacteria bacterium]
MSRYQKLTDRTRGIDQDQMFGLAGDLDAIAREGARRMLVAILEAEVTEFLGRQRQVTLGSGVVPVRAPRVRETEEPFSSQALPAYQRRSRAVKELIPEFVCSGTGNGGL